MVFVHNFSGYNISYSRSAQKDLQKIDSMYAQKIKKKFQEMAHGLSNVDVKRLQGSNNNHIFRLRVGIYRALFEVHEKTITIYVVSVEHRKDVYDAL